MPNVPKIVLQRLQSPATELHPDADLLTAFAEKSLAGPERDHVVEHLARCGDCREVVSIALPPQVGHQLLADNNMNWFRWPVLQWATVAAGVVLIASIATLQYRTQHARELASNVFDQKQLIAATPRSPDASSQPVRSATEAESQSSSGSQPPARSTHTKLNPDSRPAQKKAEARAETEPAHAPAPSEVQGEIAQNEPAELSPAADRVAKAKPAVAQSARSTLAPAPSLHIDPIVLKSLAVPRWIISATGTLQRSLDRGKTWLDVNPAGPESTGLSFMPSANTAAPSVIFRALSVSSNAAEVWAGGSSGALYHTMDSGKNWARVLPSASGITVTGDIVSIQFSAPRNGTLATSTAEIWITVDDGQTWHKQ
jgi:hypothetical protein